MISLLQIVFHKFFIYCGGCVAAGGLSFVVWVVGLSLFWGFNLIWLSGGLRGLVLCGGVFRTSIV